MEFGKLVSGYKLELSGCKRGLKRGTCDERARRGMPMKLAGKVWNTLSREDRMRLLAHCLSLKSDEIKKYESGLRWNDLMPVTQNDLLNVDFSSALGRDVQP